MFIIVGVWGSNEFGRVKAAFYFFYYSFISSFFLFFAIIFFSIIFESLDFLMLKEIMKVTELCKFFYYKGSHLITFVFGFI